MVQHRPLGEKFPPNAPDETRTQVYNYQSQSDLGLEGGEGRVKADPEKLDKVVPDIGVDKDNNHEESREKGRIVRDKQEL